MTDYLKDLVYTGLTEEEKKELKDLTKELKKYKEMETVTNNSGSNSGSEN